MTVRGCGTRSYGGIYIEVRLSARGLPLESFLVDPVREVPEGMDIPNRGVAIIERQIDGKGVGIWDAWDRVGSKYYPNVEDFLYEGMHAKDSRGRKVGFSRRISSKTDLSLLTPKSRLVLVHERAMLLNADELYRAIDIEMREMTDPHHWHCRCGKSNHDAYPIYARDSKDMMPTCVSCWREVITGGSELYDTELPNRTVERTIGELTYTARRAPVEFKPEHVEGIFAILPISGLAVINDPQASKHVPNLEKAQRSGLSVTLEDE